MKRISTFILAALFLCCTSLVANVTGGTCGPSLTWTFDSSTETLTISGTGEMTSNPWWENRGSIKHIDIHSGVTSISQTAFYETSITSIYIPDGVTSIKEGAFTGCTSLSHVRLPETLKEIGERAFSHCFSLPNIVIPASVNNIHRYVFEHHTDNFKVYLMSDESLGQIKIDREAFDYDQDPYVSGSQVILYVAASFAVREQFERNTSVRLIGKDPDNRPVIKTGTCGTGLTYTYYEDLSTLVISGTGAIDDDAPLDIQIPWKDFRESVTNIEISGGVTSIGSYAFQNCTKVSNIHIPDNVTRIGDAAFRSCSKLKSVRLPEGLTNMLGVGAFGFCSNLTDITLPNTLTAIPERAFESCSSLASITIPQGVVSLGFGTFGGCSSLSSVTFECITPPDGSALSFPEIINAVNFSVPQRSVQAYKTALGIQSTTPSPIPQEIVSLDAGLTVSESRKVFDLVISSDHDNTASLNIAPEAELTVSSSIAFTKKVDPSRYFFFTLPFSCRVSDVIQPDGKPLTHRKDFIIKKYDQKAFATGSTGWTLVADDETLTPSRGYIVAVSKSSYAAGVTTLAFYSDASQNNHKLVASADHNYSFGSDYQWRTEGSNPEKNGWNLIGNPYYHSTASVISTTNYISIPNPDGRTYEQVERNAWNGSIPAFGSYFIQATDNQSPILTLTQNQSMAPALSASTYVADAELGRLCLIISGSLGADRTVLISRQGATTDYVVNHDLTKLCDGTPSVPQIYTVENSANLAYNTRTLGSDENVTVGLYAPVSGQYTFEAGCIEGDLSDVCLFDAATGVSTRLSDDSYTVHLDQGTHDDRFQLRRQQLLPTATDNRQISGIQVFNVEGGITVRGLATDAVVSIHTVTGTLVRSVTALDHTLTMQLPSAAYILTVRSAEYSYTAKIIL